jgi:hypothetical protein
LAYFLPSIVNDICYSVVPGENVVVGGVNTKWECRIYDGKAAQIINFILSIGTTLLLLEICQKIRPNNRTFKTSVLLLLSVLTVYYKTFAQVRPEPYVVFFAALSISYIIESFKIDTFDWLRAISLGISLGLLILSRQWGFLIFPAVVFMLILVLLRDVQKGLNYFKPIFVSFVISAVVGGWFYLHLFQQYGTFTPFTRPSIELSSSTLFSFFRETHMKNYELFREPVRPNFDNSFFPVFYSDTWGDYWGFFTYIKEKSPFGENGYGNYENIVPFLGMVNLYATIPTMILLLGVLFGIINLFKLKAPLSPDRLALGLLTLIAVSSFLGFLSYVIKYFLVAPSVLKPTYILQLFIALLFPAADLLEIIKQRSNILYLLIVVSLIVVFLHNFPAMITRYSWFHFL